MDDRDHHHHHDSEDINDWQQIEPHQSPENSPALHQPGLGWDMVVVDENYLQVPVDQSSSTDDLPICHQEGSSETVSTTTTTVVSEDGTSSPSAEGGAAMTASDPTPSDWRIRIANEGRKLLKLRLETLRNGVVRVASKVRECAVCAWAFWSVMCVAGVATAVLVAVVCFGIRRRRKRVGRRQSVELEHLVSLLREKDEKISQLLLQIAQLNEVLSSRRKVRVLRISS